MNQDSSSRLSIFARQHLVLAVVMVAAHPSPWKLYVQLNGWENFGSLVTVSVDDLVCIPTPAPR